MMDDFRRPPDGIGCPTPGCNPNTLHRGCGCLVSHLSPLRLLNGSASNESLKHDLINWFGLPSDESFHKGGPSVHRAERCHERDEMKKGNKQRFNKVPDRLLINRESTGGKIF